MFRGIFRPEEIERNPEAVLNALKTCQELTSGSIKYLCDDKRCMDSGVTESPRASRSLQSFTKPSNTPRRLYEPFDDSRPSVRMDCIVYKTTLLTSVILDEPPYWVRS